MATFNYNMDTKDAIIAVKKALNGKMAILKDKNNCLTVGSPMMTVNIEFSNGSVTTKGSLAGKIIVATVDSTIELIDGFVKA